MTTLPLIVVISKLRSAMRISRSSRLSGVSSSNYAAFKQSKRIDLALFMRAGRRRVDVKKELEGGQDKALYHKWHCMCCTHPTNHHTLIL
eukprot:10165715-Ditylum_brightwellii.AAC.1